MATELQEKALEALTKLMDDQLNIGTIDFRELIDGQIKIMKSGKLKIELALPADVVLPDQDVRNVINGNWKAIPVLMFVHPENVRDEDGNLVDIYADDEEASESE
ncbi:MAG: hypothetical protein JXR12_06030 [Neptunomonas phycophila]|uniref:hypothetical protein n=1 Tax=Neptunomonas phycophila TaxID=1572645 RepID=UPI003B8C85AE